MKILTYAFKIAVQNHVNDAEIEQAIENGLQLLGGANEHVINKIDERGTMVDRDVNPWSSIEESNEWERLALKELING